MAEPKKFSRNCSAAWLMEIRSIGEDGCDGLRQLLDKQHTTARNFDLCLCVQCACNFRVRLSDALPATFAGLSH